jgi:hypothetical protein
MRGKRESSNQVFLMPRPFHVNHADSLSLPLGSAPAPSYVHVRYRWHKGPWAFIYGKVAVDLMLD